MSKLLSCVFPLFILAHTLEAQSIGFDSTSLTYELIDKRGKVKMRGDFDELSFYNEDNSIILAERNGLKGLYDSRGTSILPVKYRDIKQILGELWLVKINDSINFSLKAGVVDSKNRTIIPTDFLKIEKGIAPNQLIGQTNFQHSIFQIDKKNKLSVIFQADNISKIHNDNLYLFESNNRKGLLDKKGRLLQKAIYDSIAPIDSLHLLTQKAGILAIYSIQDEKLIYDDIKSFEIKNNLLQIEPYPVYDYLDHEANLKVKINADSIGSAIQNHLLLYKSGRNYLFSISKDSSFFLPSKEYYQFINERLLLIKENEAFFLYEYDKIGSYNAPIYSWNSANVLPYHLHLTDWMGYHYLSDYNGNLLWRGELDAISEDHNGWYRVERNGDVNWLDHRLEWILPKPVPYDTKIDPKARYIARNENGKLGIKDKHGVWYIRPVLDSLRYIEGDHYYYENKDEKGLLRINDGKEVYITRSKLTFHENLLLEWQKNEIKTIVSLDGLITDLKGVIGIETISRNKLYQLKKKNGDFAIYKTKEGVWENQFIYDSIGNFQNGFFPVKKNNRWGFIDDQGRLRVSNQYDKLGTMSEGLVPFQLNGKWGAINYRDGIKLQPQFESVGTYINGLAIVKKEGKFGITDKEGTLVVQPKYDNIRYFSDNRFLIYQGDNIGITNARGTIEIFPRYSEIKSAGFDFLIVRNSEGIYGLANRNGRNIVPFKYQSIQFDPINNAFIAIPLN
ncbi:MAG: WG repeat-containing protein [Cyclobacteriaceae bacterium]|nr:WG repeat-containing protein [Cyclobacteriaceae bacterium]MCH8515575.1 WG repeat-containing protein [Cyclobacteriaceae bacterium]